MTLHDGSDAANSKEERTAQGSPRLVYALLRPYPMNASAGSWLDDHIGQIQRPSHQRAPVLGCACFVSFALLHRHVCAPDDLHLASELGIERSLHYWRRLAEDRNMIPIRFWCESLNNLL